MRLQVLPAASTSESSLHCLVLEAVVRDLSLVVPAAALGAVSKVSPVYSCPS